MTNIPEIIKIDDFEVLFFNNSPPRLEAKIQFDRSHVSQKLIFKMMSITHLHGIGCSEPVFGRKEDGTMNFFVGIVVSSRKNITKHLQRMKGCLIDIFIFLSEFRRQLDFSTIDLSMFDGIVMGDVEKVAAVRDQVYRGSWKDFIEALSLEGYNEAADVAFRLEKFEQVNNKDLGYVGFKLNLLLDSLFEEQSKKLVLN